MIGAEEPHRLVGGDGVRQPGRLQLHPDHVAEPSRLATRVDPGDAQGAGVGEAQSLQALEGAGLARPVGTEEAEDLAGRHFEADVLDCHQVSVDLAEPLHLDCA